MGEVYRATDSRLNRDVAIKLLPPRVGQDTTRLARFKREAQVLAALAHGNIAQVYGFEEQEGRHAIVLELVEGEDLAERLKRGPLPLEDVRHVALQIAEALEAAHEKGIVHRDLKPANVKLAPDGTVKVLDFGLAKALVGDPSEGDISDSPTMTAAATQAGIILGTASYMAPEQAKGKPVDRRADVWAYGCVLYEMLTGRRPFAGDSVSEVIAHVITQEPDFTALPAGTPVPLRDLLDRCLRKDPRQRVPDMAVARIALHELDDRPVESPHDTVPPARGIMAAWWLAGIVGLVLGLGLMWFAVGDATSSKATTGKHTLQRASVLLPDSVAVRWTESIALSPDGSTLAVVGGRCPEGSARRSCVDLSSIYVRRLDSLDFEELPGTEGAVGVFFSSNGQSIGFLADGQLKTVSLQGHKVSVLCDAEAGWKGAWSSSGWIYFTFGESRLARIRDEGGAVEDLGEVGDVFHLKALPQGRGVLLTIRDAGGPSTRKDTAKIVVLSDDLVTTPVLDGGYNARYLSSGHLVFVRGSNLFAVPFDLDRLQATPPAVNVLADVSTDSVWAIAHFDISLDGTLVYLAGGDLARTVPTWVDLESGEEEQLSIPNALYNTFDLSPDGTQLAIQDLNGPQDQIWIHDARRDTYSRLTLEGSNGFPVWSHDGREVFFASNRDGEDRLFRRPVDGSAPASRLLTDEQEALMEVDSRSPSAVTPDGAFLVIYTWGHPKRGGDLWKVPLHGDGDPEVLLATDANEIIPEVSPDGRWLLFLSNERGRYEVVVRPLDDMQSRAWYASDGAGSDGIWSPQGDAILYWKGHTDLLMRTAVELGETLQFGASEVVRSIEYHDASGPSLAVSPDGRRVLVQKPVGQQVVSSEPLTLVTNWHLEVTRLVSQRQ